MMQFDLFVDPGAYKDKVISDRPYVKILGDVGWSPKDRAFITVAQVELSICVISLKLKEVA